MATQVETFECSETASEPIEASEEAIGIIDSLGLAGQQSLVSKTDKKDRCPYRAMRADEAFVYRTICPRSVEIKKYEGSPIPLRVLQIAAHANSLGIFKEMYVWSQEDSTTKDPVLVAVKHGGYEFIDDGLFILARWGDELETFSTLLKKAIGIARERLMSQARKMLPIVENMSDSDIVRAGRQSRIEVVS